MVEHDCAWTLKRRIQYFYRNTLLAGASFDFRTPWKRWRPPIGTFP
jgi:hypothetical protein